MPANPPTTGGKSYNSVKGWIANGSIFPRGGGSDTNMATFYSINFNSFIYITHLIFPHPIVWCSIYSGTTIITLYSVKGKPTSTENELRSGVKVI